MKVLKKQEIERHFNQSDIGKVFWRVEYCGVLTQCLISSLDNENKAVTKLAILTDLRNDEYVINEQVEYFTGFTCGTNSLRESSEFYYNFEDAKKASVERFNKEVNPDGLYRVAMYFDDIFRGYVTEAMSKKEARAKCNDLSVGKKYLTSYQIKSVS